MGEKPGCGFFIGPKLLVTCAHVLGKGVEEGKPVELRRWESSGFRTIEPPATVIALSAGDELALLETAAENPVFVSLGDDVRVGDTLVGIGYPQRSGRAEFDQFTATYEGQTQFLDTEGRAGTEIKFKEGQVEPGFSGGPLLNVRTGTVTGVVNATRDRISDLGGWAIDISALINLLEDRQIQLPPVREPWEQRLETLHSTGQIASDLREEVLRYVSNSMAIKEHLHNGEQAWLTEIMPCTASAPVQQVLTSVCYGIDVHVRLVAIDFVLIPPGRIGAVGILQPFYLSRIAFTAPALDSLAHSQSIDPPWGSPALGLCLTDSNEMIEALNERLLDQDEPVHINKPQADVEACGMVQYRFRLPSIHELEFATMLNGTAASQRCLQSSDLTALGRHELGIAGLVGGLWQFCFGEVHDEYYAWGGTLGLSDAEYSRHVPAQRYYNPYLKSTEQALRIAADPAIHSLRKKHKTGE
jgi:hypothetical protein